jgi:hypothetical protein
VGAHLLVASIRFGKWMRYYSAVLRILFLCLEEIGKKNIRPIVIPGAISSHFRIIL